MRLSHAFNIALRLIYPFLFPTHPLSLRSIFSGVSYLPFQNPKTENNPYLGFVYTSFQERATAISHGNTARQAKQYGCKKLAVMSGLIAADEKRHERAYGAIVDKLFELDPNGAMLGFEDMMRKQIIMPAHMMHDGVDPDLFDHYSQVR